jgi:hypothetical protein
MSIHWDHFPHLLTPSPRPRAQFLQVESKRHRQIQIYTGIAAQ